MQREMLDLLRAAHAPSSFVHVATTAPQEVGSRRAEVIGGGADEEGSLGVAVSL